MLLWGSEREESIKMCYFRGRCIDFPRFPCAMYFSAFYTHHGDGFELFFSGSFSSLVCAAAAKIGYWFADEEDWWRDLNAMSEQKAKLKRRVFFASLSRGTLRRTWSMKIDRKFHRKKVFKAKLDKKITNPATRRWRRWISTTISMNWNGMSGKTEKKKFFMKFSEKWQQKAVEAKASIGGKSFWHKFVIFVGKCM